jgi:hypothetical protein
VRGGAIVAQPARVPGGSLIHTALAHPHTRTPIHPHIHTPVQPYTGTPVHPHTHKPIHPHIPTSDGRGGSGSAEKAAREGEGHLEAHPYNYTTIQSHIRTPTQPQIYTPTNPYTHKPIHPHNRTGVGGGGSGSSGGNCGSAFGGEGVGLRDQHHRHRHAGGVPRGEGGGLPHMGVAGRGVSGHSTLQSPRIEDIVMGASHCAGHVVDT